MSYELLPNPLAPAQDGSTCIYLQWEKRVDHLYLCQWCNVTLCADDEISSTQERNDGTKEDVTAVASDLETKAFFLHSVTLNWSRTLFRPPGRLCTKTGQT